MQPRRKNPHATGKSLLGEVLDAWAYARQGVVAEVNNLPESAFDFRPHNQARTTRELVQHIIESGLMMSGELSRPDGDFLGKPYPALLKDHGRSVSRHRTKAALIAALTRTHADGVKRVAAFGEVAMLQTIRQFNGEPAMRTWMHHGIAHEEYHRGQLALYARLMGRVPALTQLIQGGRSRLDHRRLARTRSQWRGVRVNFMSANRDVLPSGTSSVVIREVSVDRS